MSASDDLYGNILRQGPSSGTLFLLLSEMKRQGELRRLIQIGTHALDLYPEDIPIRRLMAEAFLEAGMASRAEAEMEKVSRQITDLATIFKHKAELLARQQRSREALKALQIYLAHYPDDRDALGLLQGLTPSEEPPVADMPEAVSEEMSEEAPGDLIEEAGMEEPLPEVVSPDEVPEEVEPATGPDIATPTLAEVYLSQGQREEAIRTYERVLEMYPEDDDYRHRLEEIRNMEEGAMPASPDAPLDPSMGAPVDQKDRMQEKTKRMITTLETWLEEMREMNKPPH